MQPMITVTYITDQHNRLLTRQVRYQAALRPDSEDSQFYCCFL